MVRAVSGLFTGHTGGRTYHFDGSDGQESGSDGTRGWKGVEFVVESGERAMLVERKRMQASTAGDQTLT